MTLLRLDASIRTTGSHSRHIADLVEREWRASRPRDEVVRREIATEPLPADAWGTALDGAAVPHIDRSDAHNTALALAASLADELITATALLFAVPLYNYGVSQHFKAYVDLVLCDPRMSAPIAPATRGAPALLVTTRGGRWGSGVPRGGWDHSTAFMRHVLEDAFHLDVLMLELDTALVEDEAAEDRGRHLAAQLCAWADGEARVRGRAPAAATSEGRGTGRRSGHSR